MKKKYNLNDFVDFCSGTRKIKLRKSDIERVGNCRNLLEALRQSGAVYGTTTGVGALFKERVSLEDADQIQKRLIRSHAVGVGPPITREEARGMMFLLINMLRKGYSGVSLPTLEFLVELFNRDVIPAIPSQGSLGASGDLAPLAHLALVLIGEGHVMAGDKPIPTMRSLGFGAGHMRPINLQAGEALALINGTHLMTSILGLAVYHAEILLKTADIIGALSFSALRANPEAFLEIIHELRSHPGQIFSATNIRKLLQGVERLEDLDLQAAYSLRCMGQVNGPIKETIEVAKKVVECEMNSISGNPIFADGRVLHGGNFHGHPLALQADFLSIALTTLSGISERRIERLLNPSLSHGLPSFLADKSESGDCGLMMAQCTAASLVSENKTLSHPASIDSIPTSAGQEDFVSMGALAARKARWVCLNTQRVLAVELLAAMKASAFRGGLPDFVSSIRELFHNRMHNRNLAGNIELSFELIGQGAILDEVEKVVGNLD